MHLRLAAGGCIFPTLEGVGKTDCVRGSTAQATSAPSRLTAIRSSQPGLLAVKGGVGPRKAGQIDAQKQSRFS
jgi:hypothetical protein